MYSDHRTETTSLLLSDMHYAALSLLFSATEINTGIQSGAISFHVWDMALLIFCFNSCL